MRIPLLALAIFSVSFVACIDEGPGSDFDLDGLPDKLEDPNANFIYEPELGETDMILADTDGDGLCDGLPSRELEACSGCEDCNNSGTWEPCLGETDPLNDDTDGDGTPDASDPDPLDGLDLDCSDRGQPMSFGSSVPEGKGFPPGGVPTPTPTPDFPS